MAASSCMALGLLWGSYRHSSRRKEGALFSPFDQCALPLRGEPFSTEHLCEYAERKAAEHRVTHRSKNDRRFIDQFKKNSEQIATTYRTIVASMQNGDPVPPDAEWLIDNYYVVEEQLREIREDLPRRFYRELPKLSEGSWAGLPRVYELAYDVVTHTDSELDEDLITQVVDAYQRVTHLTSGEIWAIPIMLRLVLVENLRRLCEQILATHTYRRQAQLMTELAQRNGEFQLTMAAMANSPPLVLQLIECTRDGDRRQPQACLREFEEYLGREGQLLDDFIRTENQRLAANQVSIGNLITSMRLISALDWTLFFERVSPVERLLSKDPAGVYASMDFSTRDSYRHVVEKMAKRNGCAETEIVTSLLELASSHEHADDNPKRSHVCYYLIGDGRRELEKRTGYRRRPGEVLAQIADRHALLAYLGAIAVPTLSGAAGCAVFVHNNGGSTLASILAAILMVLPCSEIVIGTVNLLVTKLVCPRALPKMDFKLGIPFQYRTMVVVPSMLTSALGVHRLLERLEIHYLANPESDLQFALLSDFADSPEEKMPSDADLLEIAISGIREMNQRLGGERDRFCLFHRERRWNEAQRAWMGWERKRGKLLEFNRLIRGCTDTSFTTQAGDWKSGTEIKFVITLDADTRLPHAAARRLAATLAHPLNRPRFDPSQRRVTQGYGLLQPRVSVSLEGAQRSLYTRIFANSPGIDPYYTAVSDVYQDLFHEGSFTGKGIYDVDAFAHAVDDAFPENQILSHDLIEGCHARVGLVTDVELFDEYPSRYEADARRQHRWVRGDWQLLPWLWPQVPTAAGWQRNPLTVLSHWKVLDNLRRSLVAPSLVLILLVGWLLTVQYAVAATIAVLVVVAFPMLGSLMSLTAEWPQDVHWRQHAHDRLLEIGRSLAQSAVSMAFLGHKAYMTVDAISRTIVRMFVSRRRLLDWETADATERRIGRSSWTALREMWFGPALAVASSAFLPVESRFVAAPILLLWLISPLLAYWIGLPTQKSMAPLSSKERAYLRQVARRTWSYFEQFAGEVDHWLPPDNYQEYPKGKIAHRVSPTNAGFYIVTAIAARDFRHISLSSLDVLLWKNLHSLQRLERCYGHFYNWYDTTTLLPLRPRYVSTADSGNLATCLIAASEATDDLLNTPLFDEHSSEGLNDTVALLIDAVSRLPIQLQQSGVAKRDREALGQAVHELERVARTQPAGLSGWRRLCNQLHGRIQAINKHCEAYGQPTSQRVDDFRMRLQSLEAYLQGISRDIELFAPWVAVSFPEGQSAMADDAHEHPRLPWSTSESRSQCMWRELLPLLESPQSLATLATMQTRARLLAKALQDGLTDEGAPTEAHAWLDALLAAVDVGASNAAEYCSRFRRLAKQYDELAMQMDFTILYNSQRRLFAVGYDDEEDRLDRAHYDMLASEARSASLFAIAKGDVDHRHWFQMGRTLTSASGFVSLLSWGGTMLEYLMPTIFTHDVSGSLVTNSSQAAVAHQIEYGRKRRVPWGISESAYGAQAANSDYQYQSFGVPGLGLKRGLAKDLVISPYSTALALAFHPQAAVANLVALEQEGALGVYGFYDAIDYTPERIPPGSRSAVVACYMAHHHGMTMAALANCVYDNCMRKRFQRHPLSRATDLLLQERVPSAVLRFQPQSNEVAAVPQISEVEGPVSRKLTTAATSSPRAHLLSNGQYSVMITNAGGGYSKCGETALTRWRADRTRDAWGQFVYLRDVSTGHIWSAAHQPTCQFPDSYEVTYSLDKAEFRRRDGSLDTHMEVAVSPENNAEVRQVTITNLGVKTAVVDVTSYAEIVLSTARADLAHPAFSKLFLETEYVPEHRALIARRRPRDAAQELPWAIHTLASADLLEDHIDYETDRMRFIGRGRTTADPAAVVGSERLSGTVGSVLDPIFSMCGRVRIPSGTSVVLAFATAFATSREDAIALADQYHDPRGVHRTFELAWAHSQIELRHLHLSSRTAQFYQRIASTVLFPEPSRRAAAHVLAANRLGQSGLWRHGISGDEPIVLLRLTKLDQRSLLRELLLAHEYWHVLGLKVDLVVLNESISGYFDVAHEQFLELVQTTVRVPLHKPGGVFLLRGAHFTPDEMTLFESVASISLHGERGSLEKQFNPSATTYDLPLKSASIGSSKVRVRHETERRLSPPSLDDEFQNAYGGFTAEGREYAICVRPGESTPLPWSNVVANPQFGFLLTESGGGYTWAVNSRENKLTTWCNDPVSDTPSEVVYIRDNDTGEVWSATPLPVRDNDDCLIFHGCGYSKFARNTRNISSELLLTIAPADRVKFVCLKVKNNGAQRRSLSIAYFAELVLGVSREETQLHVLTAIDKSSGALVARNHYHSELSEQAVFLQMVDRTHSITADRTEFLGRNGSVAQPHGFRNKELSGTVGTAHDSCGALKTDFMLEPGAEADVYILVGQSATSEDLQKTLAKYSTPATIRDAMRQTSDFWDEVLDVIQIRTPNRALDLMVNRWLLYQTLSCRIWGRTSFYQSGGAFGFRDQLQDVMAVVYAVPQVAREHILHAASRQFEEGDVQHWWHPPTGRGVRTRFADDLLWLPLSTCHYVRVTGDVAILDDQVSYLHAPILEPHEEERYELPGQSTLRETLYEHCVRAIDRALQFGAHGLPLMGCGDWNDGMNKVGAGGQGESVWMAWFLAVVLKEFVPVAEARGDHGRAVRYRELIVRMLGAVEDSSWDGAWYRRAYFDDGSPLGSAQNEECRIDSIAQSWSVKAGSNLERARRAMQSVEELLVRQSDRLILLFDPPFDKSSFNPGYIKGYLPGIRENGGQYTHAALWVVEAMAMLGRGTRAVELLDLLNPVLNGAKERVETYRTEPYAVAADVYSKPPHIGCAGWTWYTGSAAWMYRVVIESILGLQLRGNRLRMVPCIPRNWPEFELALRYGRSKWRIHVINPQGVEQGVTRVSIDGKIAADGEAVLVDDETEHTIRIELG